MKKLIPILFTLVFLNSVYAADIDNVRLDNCAKAQHGKYYNPKDIEELNCSRYCYEVEDKYGNKLYPELPVTMWGSTCDANAKKRQDKCEIFSLQGIQEFTKLKKLNLSNHNLTEDASYEHIHNMGTLQELILNDANMKKLPPIHADLRKLEANNNQINDIEGLANPTTEFKKIRYLSLKNNKLTDNSMDPFYHMTVKAYTWNHDNEWVTKSGYVDKNKTYFSWGRTYTRSVDWLIINGDGANLLVSEFGGNNVQNGWEVNTLNNNPTEQQLESYLGRNILPVDYLELLNESINLQNQQYFNDCIRNNGGSMYYIPSMCYIYQD